MKFLFVCNEGPYLLNETRWAITSLARHEPQITVSLVLFDSTGKYDRRVKRWHPNIEITHFEPDEPIDRSKPGFFFSFKTLVFEHALQSTSQDMLFLDGDIIVRGPLSPIFDEMGDADLAIRYRPSLKLLGPMGDSGSAKFNTGVVAIRNSQATRQLMADVRAMIATHLENQGPSQRSGPSITTIDQEAMWLAYEAQRDTLTFHPLNDIYNDAYFLPQSVIWHAKGNARQHPMYLAAVDELRFGRWGAWRHRKQSARHAARINRARDARARLQAEAFGLAEDETLQALETLGDGKLLSFSSDFLLANSALSAAAGTTVCFDWDPAAFHTNRQAMRTAGIPHHFSLAPGAVDLSDVALVLTDTDDVAPTGPALARILPLEARFQDQSTLFKLMRDFSQ